MPTASTMAVVRGSKTFSASHPSASSRRPEIPWSRAGSWLFGPDLTYQTSRFRGDKNLAGRVSGPWPPSREDLPSGDRTALGVQSRLPERPLGLASFSYNRIGDAFDPSLGFVPRRRRAHRQPSPPIGSRGPGVPSVRSTSGSAFGRTS